MGREPSGPDKRLRSFSSIFRAQKPSFLSSSSDSGWQRTLLAAIEDGPDDAATALITSPTALSACRLFQLLGQFVRRLHDAALLGIHA
jgi:hypothetical protein